FTFFAFFISLSLRESDFAHHRRFPCEKRGNGVPEICLVDRLPAALLDLPHATLHLRACEVLVRVVHRLELAAIDRDDGFGFRGQAQGATERSKPSRATCIGLFLQPQNSQDFPCLATELPPPQAGEGADRVCRSR